MAEHLGLEVHYAPGDRPLCGAESWVALYTDDPALVSGCGDCLKLVAEDLGDGNDYMGHCIHCRQGITAPEAWLGAAWSEGPACTMNNWEAIVSYQLPEGFNAPTSAIPNFRSV